uniref:DDE Tnp4 domain-containing protein n=1 Tax=Stomoxys calcitrans TaxID=35570 RepID=A0A1I8NMW1_STOCA
MSSKTMEANAKIFDKWNFPNCVGAIDGKHFSIKCPPNSGSIFYNYKNFFSIVLLTVANGDYQFTYFDVGAYGSEGDGSVFRKCSLAIRQNMLPFPSSYVACNPYVFVADDAFPLHRRIMKPFKPTKTTINHIIHYF